MTAQQLKNSILQMAVQGKLVPQDPNDEPASVLLERIRAEKEQLIKQKKIKREKNPSVIFKGADNTPYEKIGDEVKSLSDYAPFEIPANWEWCRVGDLFTNMSGLAYKKEALAIKASQMIRVLRGGNIGDETYCLKADDVFIASEYVKPELLLKRNYMITPAVSSLEHIGKIALVKDDLPDTVVGGFVLMLMPIFTDDLMSEYLLYAFAAKNHRDNCRSITHKSGQAFYNLSRELLMNLPVPIPPRAEMVRIVTKLKEVLPVVQTYDSVESESTKLASSFPVALKKSILQWAVQGKLVPQHPEDEPASVLLERIRIKKEALIKSGKIKRDKHESVIFRRDNSHYEKLDGIERCIDDEIPFDVPDSWSWTRLGSLVQTITSGSRDWAKYYSETGSLFLRMGNLSKNSFDLRLTNLQRVQLPEKAEGTRTSLQAGDLLFSITGEVGMLGLIPEGFETAYINQHTAVIRFISLIRNKYLPYFLLTEYAQKGYKAHQHGIKNSFRLDSISDILVPVPPLQEQERIINQLELSTGMINAI